MSENYLILFKIIAWTVRFLRLIFFWKHGEKIIKITINILKYVLILLYKSHNPGLSIELMQYCCMSYCVSERDVKGKTVKKMCKLQ